MTPRGKQTLLATSALILAMTVTLVAGHPTLSFVKLAGVTLAVLAVIPVFILLNRALKSQNTTRVLWTFAGGFLFKLILVLSGIWYGISRLGWDAVDFSVGCLAFLFALQVCESIYFS